jgi:hypothetical protein
MAVPKKFRVETLQTVAAACAVYRMFNRTVKKPEIGITAPTSKQMLLDHFNGVSLLDITEADQSHATEVINSIQHRNMVDKLAGRASSPFFLDVAERLEKESVSSSDFGIVVWAPKLVDDLTSRDDQHQQQRQILHDSAHIGTQGKSIAIEFHPLSYHFKKDYNTYVMLGHDGCGNAVSFWHKFPVDRVRSIKGKVKHHGNINAMGNIRVTNLNYVKMADKTS